MTSRTITTVTDPASNYDLVTLANAKADMSITDTADDVFLARAISVSSAKISQYCNRVFPVETVQDLIDFEPDNYPYQYPDGPRPLQLSRYPVVADSLTLIEETTTLVEGTDFRVDYALGQVHRLNQWSLSAIRWPSRLVTVTYDAGFDTIPLDLQEAATRVVKAMRFNRTRDPLLKSENILSGLYAYTLFDPSQVATGDASIVAEVLDNYRVPVVA